MAYCSGTLRALRGVWDICVGCLQVLWLLDLVGRLLLLVTSRRRSTYQLPLTRQASCTGNTISLPTCILKRFPAWHGTASCCMQMLTCMPLQ